MTVNMHIFFIHLHCAIPEPVNYFLYKFLHSINSFSYKAEPQIWVWIQ